MKRSKICLAAVSAAMLLLFATACNNDNDITTDELPQGTEEPTETPAEEPHASENTDAIAKMKIAGKVTSEFVLSTNNYADFVTKVNQFSAKTSILIGCNGQDNTVVSPLSIFMALGMSVECADNNTRKELLEALGLTYEELISNINYLCYTCNQILSQDDQTEARNLIKCVNSLWLNPKAETKEKGLEQLTKYYYSDIFKMDANCDINKIITSYIKNETNGFLSPDLQLSSDVEMVLMNVVYLKEIWKNIGIELNLSDKQYNFQNYDGSTTTTPLLEGEYFEGKAETTDSYRKFYTSTNSGYTLTFIVPNTGYTIDDIFTADVLNQKDNYLYEDEAFIYKTRCLFPEFTAEYDNDIKDIISQMGVNDFFVPGACDFSHLTDQQVFCNKIKHVTKLEATRKGIEGAAVTAVEMLKNALPIEDNRKEICYDFVVDRNFVFSLKNRDGVTLFTGVVKKVK